MNLYHPLRRLTWNALRLAVPVRVEGREHVPTSGPFVLLPNHQSALDPILAQGPLTADIHAMTKSTQFTHPFFRWFLPRVNAFPTRRFRVDPQAVRVVLRLLARGRGVVIYPEGERTWDGSLQSFRRGTVRVLLKADVPIIPCGVYGSFDVLPRWSRRFHRHPVTVRYGPPIRFGPHPDRSMREAALDDAIRVLTDAVRRLDPAARDLSRQDAALTLARMQADIMEGAGREGGAPSQGVRPPPEA